MSKFRVCIPITGQWFAEVEAETREAAIDAAWGTLGDDDKGEVYWEGVTKVCQGNVFSGVLNEIEVDEVGK